MQNNEQQEKIELYLEGKLDREALEQFEQEMNSDEAFKRRVNITKDVNERFDDALFAKKLNELVQPFNEKYIDNQSDSHFLFKYKWLLLGLLGLSIAGISVFFWSNSKSENNVDNSDAAIFAMYYKAYEPSFTNRSTSIEEDQQTILQYYQEKNYQAAIPLIEPLLKDSSANNEWKMVLGICYLNTENRELAIQLFEEIANGDVYFMRDLGQWYLALAHFKNENKAAAKPILEKLASQKNGKYAKLAKDLLSKL